MNDIRFQEVHEFIEDLMNKIFRPPQGLFKYPSLTTTSGGMYPGMFTWDTHHMTLRFAMGGKPEMMKYFLLTMLQFQSKDGFVPCICSAAKGGCKLNGFHAQPFLAQNAAVYFARTKDLETVREVFAGLKKYLKYWLESASAPFGLFRWRETWMSGFDNEIAGTIFPTGSILPADLPSLLFLECRAMGYLSRQLGCEDPSFDERADKIAEAVDSMLWDEELGVYSVRNLLTGKLQTSWGDGTLDSTVGKYAYVSCPSLLPLFAGIATPERADRMIRQYVLSPEHFRSPWGIRSLSKSSEYCNNARWGNPPRFGEWSRLTNSNWQGPVWIPLNWFVFHALLRYGFRQEAEALADDTVKVVWKNIRELGFMRENFHETTGEGLYADEFASWNILSDKFHSYLKGQGLDLFPWQSR